MSPFDAATSAALAVILRITLHRAASSKGLGSQLAHYQHVLTRSPRKKLSRFIAGLSMILLISGCSLMLRPSARRSNRAIVALAGHRRADGLSDGVSGPTSGVVRNMGIAGGGCRILVPE